MRRGHVAPQNTYLDTIIRKFEGQSEYRALRSRSAPPRPGRPPNFEAQRGEEGGRREGVPGGAEAPL